MQHAQKKAGMNLHALMYGPDPEARLYKKPSDRR
jgi:hypothetical protein